MVRTSWVMITGLLLGLAGACPAAEGLAGSWKLSFLSQGRMNTFWIVKFEQKDEKWTSSIVATNEGVPPGAKIEQVKLSADKLNFNVLLQKNDLVFEGKVSKEKPKTILGCLAIGRQAFPAQLEATQAKTLDPFELAREEISKETGPELFNMVFELLQRAEEKKVKAEEVRGWSNKAFTAAEPYGPRWQREVALRMSQSLLSQDEFAPVALEYARKAKRLLDPSDDIDSQLKVMNYLASALIKGNKLEEANTIDAEADQLFLKKPAPFPLTKFAGRQKKSDRVVLVELFTGAECPPCVASDMAFDGVEKTYPSSDVVLLQYHLHIPSADPLTNEDTVARAKYYDEEVEGTPAVLFNGKLKAMASEGGPASLAADKFKAFRAAIDPLLETTATLKLVAKAVRKGNKIDISAEATDIEKPGAKMRLRLALVEEQVRYPGGNGMRIHHRVVRAMPGGVEGLALKEKTGKQEVSLDLAVVRENFDKYLNEYGKKAKFPNMRRPLQMKDLYLVAFVQNDETKEVLQAVQVKIAAE